MGNESNEAVEYFHWPRRQPHLKSNNFQSGFRPRQENDSSKSNPLLYHAETPIISALGQAPQTPSILQPLQNSDQTCIDPSSAPNWNVHKFSQRESQTWTLSKRVKLDLEAQLCDKCALLDFENIFKSADEYFSTNSACKDLVRDRLTPDGFFVMLLPGRLSKWSTCPLCRLFWTTKLGSGYSNEFELRAFSSLTSSYFIQPGLIRAEKRAIGQKTFLAIVPSQSTEYPENVWRSTGSIYRSISPSTHLGGFWGREIAEWVVFDLVREWLQFCIQHHRGMCIRANRREKIDISGFRLIDCEAMPPKVEPRTSIEKYVALSYV